MSPPCPWDQQTKKKRSKTTCPNDVDLFGPGFQVDDARATLAIYRTQKDEWEAFVRKEQARQQAHPPV
jgi:hypothetical protein